MAVANAMGLVAAHRRRSTSAGDVSASIARNRGRVSDEWNVGRPDGRVVVEVPLIGDATSERDDVAARHPASERRRSLALAVLFGVVGAAVLAVVVAVVILGDDEVGQGGAALTPDELSNRITTPPTLQPLTALPPPDDPALLPSATGPRSTSGGAPPRIDPPPETPVYAAVPGVDQFALDDFDINEAVDRLGDDMARRSTTHVELGSAGFVLDVTIVRDPVRDRYRLTLEARGQTEVVIVDGATGTTYINPGTDNRIEVPNSEILADSDSSSVNEFFDRLLLGPLRPDTVDAAAIQGRGLVMIDEVGLARRFVSRITGSLVPEWQIYVFGPASEFRVEERPSQLDYFAYVDEHGDLAQVDGVAFIGSVPQLVTHRIERLDPPEPVDLTTDVTSPGVTGPVVPAAVDAR